jgi:hypothetical protein
MNRESAMAAIFVLSDYFLGHLLCFLTSGLADFRTFPASDFFIPVKCCCFATLKPVDHDGSADELFTST